MHYISYEPIYVTAEKARSEWSHWGELNPRPSPYQGDAIPLSHSGSAATTEGVGLIVATIGSQADFERQCENQWAGAPL